MLKERKLLRKSFEGDDIVGYYIYPAYIDDLYVKIKDDNSKPNINDEEYFITEFESVETESDYHTFTDEYHFNGVYMAFNLNNIDTKKYFGEDFSDELFDKNEFILGISSILEKNGYRELSDNNQIMINEEGYLQVVCLKKKLDNKIVSCSKEILKYIRNYYDKCGVHITRMFGSYILLKKEEGELKAIKATSIPIKYCPLMIKLLEEVGGDAALKIIETLTSGDQKQQEKAMVKLINEVVINGGYFDTNRALNSCEANVLFGASETMSSAFKSNLIDAAVIVSNNLGTIITTNEFNTQGAVKRMTGLFYTSPNNEIMNTAYSEGIIPVFPYTAEIDQLEGVRKAIEFGAKNIAVSVAASDNYLHEHLKKLEEEFGITIYKFGLCSTGINYDTAISMKNFSDVVWSCASKYVKEEIEPSAIAQVGVKIPVHIMTKQGWDIVSNHLKYMGFYDDVNLQQGNEKPVLLNSQEGIKVLKKERLRKCNDCPHPCI